MSFIEKVHQILKTPQGVYPSVSRRRLEGTSGVVFRRCRNFRFEIFAPAAKEVHLAGDFNNWDEKSIAMDKDEDGLWSAEVHLPSGKYEYKFIVDQEWWLDPSNPNAVSNSFGVQNSVKQFTV